MRRLVVSSLLANKLRLALSALAVVLGVAFVAGTLVFTDTLGRTFSELTESTATDVMVQRAAAVEGQQGVSAVMTVDEADVRTAAAVDGVAEAVGFVSTQGVYVIGADGKVVATGGAPGVGVGWAGSDLLGMTLVEGEAPTDRDEVLLDETTAERTGYGVGDAVEVLTPGPRLEATVSGVMRFGESGGLAGATLVAFDERTAQELLAAPGSFHGISVDGADGVTDDTLATRVERALGPGYDVVTRAEQADDQAEAVEEGLGFVSTFLLAFSAVALFVGSFIILNTFGMLVAQRTRQLALLRALGASRRQVTGSVLVEALVLGLVGSTGGLALGVGVAVGLRELFATMGLTLDGSLVVSWQTVLACYAVGVLVTVLAAWRPARRAALVPAVAALRDDQAMSERGLRVRAWSGGALAAPGAGALTAGATGLAADEAAPALVGAGSVVLLAAVVVLAPALAGPFVRATGAVLPRLAGPAGRLARDNALRNPRRTAATASALMVGAALVAGFSIVGESANASIGTTVDETMRADLIVSTAVGQPFSPEVAEQVAALDGVDRVGTMRLGVAELDGEVTTFLAADDQVTAGMLELDVLEGSTAGLGSGDGGLLVDEATAEDRGWAVGDTVTAVGTSGTTLALPVRGTYPANPAVGPVVVSAGALERLGSDGLDRWVLVSLDDAAEPADVRAAAEGVVADYPVVSVKDMAEFTQEQQAQVGQVLLLIDAMLVLSVLIAVLGIVNTLALSVMERTREIGLLRAVGMGRRQLRRAVRLEAVLIALFGALLGLALGAASGTSLVQILDGQGVEELAVPAVRLGGLVVVAAVVGVAAAVWPARRAARLPILQAITTT